MKWFIYQKKNYTFGYRLTLLDDEGLWHKGSVHHGELIRIQYGVEPILCV
jgi:hypothetical protein